MQLNIYMCKLWLIDYRTRKKEYPLNLGNISHIIYRFKRKRVGLIMIDEVYYSLHDTFT